MTKQNVDIQHWIRIGLLGAILITGSGSAHAYYGIAAYTSALVTFIVAVNVLLYGATLGLIFFTPLRGKPFYAMLWGVAGLVALLLYLLNMNTLFAISFLTPLVLFLYVLVKMYDEPEMADKKKALRETFMTRNQARTRKERFIFWGLMLSAQVVALVGFAALADMSQWVIQSPREFIIGFFLARWFWFWVAVVLTIASLVYWWIKRTVTLTILIALTTFIVLNVYSGWFNPGLMFRSQQWGAHFAGFDMADEVLKDSDEVVVVEINGDARAYSDLFIMQPHVIGDVVGGEEVVMTYCGLSHLGMAYSPFINDQRLDLKVFSQLENNLIMWDAVSGLTVQQIRGHFEKQEKRMKDLPSFRMSYGSFKELFPNGYVFYNPIASLKENPIKHYWDSMTRLIMFHAVDIQHENPDTPVFPTLDLQDSRLPWKEKIYGVRKNGDAIAYTRQFLKDNPFLRTTIGGEEIVIVYNEDVHNVKRYDEDEMHGIVTPFYADGYTGESVDVYGNTDDGRKLRRFEGMLSQLFWMIWVNFEKDTAINRV
jgi:hypothetical protein